jgi:pimeloyl-ACP methyl ester carboxylesterase
MDALRKALGERQIRYFGLSYGTILGSVYASLFPQRVGAMVLDGGVPAEY